MPPTKDHPIFCDFGAILVFLQFWKNTHNMVNITLHINSLFGSNWKNSLQSSASELQFLQLSASQISWWIPAVFDGGAGRRVRGLSWRRPISGRAWCSPWPFYSRQQRLGHRRRHGSTVARMGMVWGWSKTLHFFGKNQGILDCLSLMILYHDSSESPRIAGCRLHPQVFGREPVLDIYNQERIVKRRWELKRFQHGHVSRCFQERSAMPGLQPVTPS